MKILFVGDIVGAPGRRVFKQVAQRWRTQGGVHVIVANAENAAAGSGITAPTAEELFAAGADALTLGDHAWGQKDAEQYIARETRVVRPANFPPGVPGRGWTVVQSSLGPLAVVALAGRVFMAPVDCPFRAADEVLRVLPGGVPVLVDFHAEATSEKIAMAWHLDGRVAALIGTHTHVQTSDERILPRGTAYITDAGMAGPVNSVIGREVAPVLRKFTTGMPARFDVAGGPAVLEGVLLEIDRQSGRVRAIERVREFEDAA